MDEERLRPGDWLGLVFCVPFGALPLMVRWQKGPLAHKKLRSTNTQRFSVVPVWFIVIKMLLQQPFKTVYFEIYWVHCKRKSGSSIELVWRCVCWALSIQLSVWHCLHLLLSAMLQCWVPSAISRYLLPTQCSAANPACGGFAAIIWWDRQIDTRHFHRPCSTIFQRLWSYDLTALYKSVYYYYVGSANN